LLSYDTLSFLLYFYRLRVKPYLENRIDYGLILLITSNDFYFYFIFYEFYDFLGLTDFFISFDYIAFVSDYDSSAMIYLSY